MNVSRRQFLGLAGSAAAVAGLGLAGCGSSSSDEGSAAATSDSVEGKTFIVAMDTVYPPFEFTNDEGEFVGIDVDILKAVAEKKGFEFDIQSVGFDAALAAAESGQADCVMAGMSITDEREKKWDFSNSYYDTYPCVAADAENDAVESLDDIKNSTVAGKTATAATTWAESVADEYGFSITYFDTTDLMYQDVLSGNSVACFEDFAVMSYGVSQGNGLKVIHEVPENAQPYGFAVLKGKNAELLAAFNEGLQELKDSGEYDEILAKYI